MSDMCIILFKDSFSIDVKDDRVSITEGDVAVIAARCRTEGGLTEADLGELRAELGYRKLGRWVLREVAEALESANLGYFPPGMLEPEWNTVPRMTQKVWIYDKSGDARTRVIDAVLNPEDHDVRAILNGLVAGKINALNPQEKLERIREIVMDVENSDA
jgi:hypothetical protein